MNRLRCPWAGNPLARRYHDREWGVPLHDDRRLFEFLILEGAQAGLSWQTILERRPGYRAAFDRFSARRIAAYDARRIRALLADARIIRNRAKIEAAVANATAFLAVRREFGTFDRYLWQFVGGQPRHNRWRRPADVPACTPASEAMSRDLRGRGFAFVGPTICYALMQATGMVNDHLVSCFRHAELRASVAPARSPQT